MTLAFPNTYSVGITSLGFQVIWATLAQRIDVDVRRLFTDQKDIPHKNSDLFGFSLSWELDGPILLQLLKENRIPIWSHLRTEYAPIIFGGGQVLTANPEPFAPFLDVVLLGDGEKLLPEFISAAKEIEMGGQQDVVEFARSTKADSIMIIEENSKKFKTEKIYGGKLIKVSIPTNSDGFEWGLEIAAQMLSDKDSVMANDTRSIALLALAKKVASTNVTVFINNLW